MLGAHSILDWLPCELIYPGLTKYIVLVVLHLSPRLDRGSGNFYIIGVTNARVAQVNLQLDENLKASMPLERIKSSVKLWSVKFTIVHDIPDDRYLQYKKK